MMKNLLLFVFTLLFSILSFAQGNNCANAEPFCTGSTYNFPAGVNSGSAEGGNNYGCLWSQPNPAWYYMEIDQPGNMTIQMSNSNNVDIDFILYGPYTSYAQAMGYCGNMGTAGNGAALNGIVDCSYSAAATEYADITSAQSGQVYVLLITNYSNQNTNISFTASGSATTDCGIVEPCVITSLNVTIGACTPATGLFNVTGTVGIVDPPTTGSLIAVDCNGNQTTVANAPFGSASYNFAINNITADGAACGVNVYFTADPTCAANIAYNNPPPCDPDCFITYLETNISACNPSDNTFNITGVVEFQDAPTTGTMTVSDCNGNSQVFNAPFTSPTNYSLNGINSDGTANCNITVVFSADPACTMSSGLFNYPSNCVCDAAAGTYSDAIIGNTNTTGLDVNLCFGDQLNIIGNGDFVPSEDFNLGGVTYDPGQWLLVYDCPPTVGPPGSINSDPCLLGVASTNDQAWGILNNVGDGATLYFVPVTMYSMVDGIYAISINGGNWCYDLGPTYEVTYLPQITTTPVENCQAGTLAVTVNGGQPAVDGSSFTASNLLPASASFVNTTTTNGGTINVSGLVDGDNYSFNVVDVNGCPATVSGTFTGVQDASFTYPSNQYCQNEPNPSPTVTGVTGGTFSSTAGLSINASTGVINLGASTPGTYTVSYQSPHAVCFSIETFIITIDPQPVITVNDPSICAGQTVTLTANGANTYTWSPGTNLSATTGASVDANPPSTTSYTVTGTNTATGCQNTDIATVTVNAIPTVNAGADQTICVGATVTLTGSGNAASYTWNNGVTNGVAFSPSATNTYTVTGTSAAGCINTDQVAVTVNPLPNVFAGADFSVCTNTPITLSGSGANTYTWTNGVTNGVAFTPAGTATYTVTGTDANGCVNTDAITVTVLGNAPINAGPNQAICSGNSATLTATGGVSYTWDNGLGAGASHVVSPAATTTYTVNGTDANGCPGTDQMTVTVNPNPIAVISGDDEYCQGSFATISAGAGYTQYQWSNGANTQTTTVTAADNPITVTITNSFGCQTTSAAYNVTEVNQIVTNSAFSICQGESMVIHGQNQSTSGVYSQTYTSVFGCDSTSNVTLTVNPLPNVNAGADQTVCSGTSVTLSGAGAQTYVWNNGVTNGVSFTPSVGSVTYTVTGTDANGCVNTDQVVVTVNPLPTATIAGTAQVCINEPSPNITFTGANGTAPYTFTYNINGGGNQNVTTASGNSVTVAVPTGVAGTFTYNLVSVTDASTTTCSQTQSGSVVVTVHALPNVFAGNDLTTCEGETVVLTGSGAATYTWDNGVVNGVPFVPSSTTTYTVTGTSQAGCQNTDDVTVNVVPIPDVSFTGVNLIGCSPMSPTFTNTSTGNLTNCVWSFSNGQTLAGCSNVTATFTTPGCYDVTLTVTTPEGCSNSETIANYVCVEPNPVADFSANPSVMTTVDPSTQLINSSTGASTYNWTFGDGSGSSNEVSPIHTYPDGAGVYVITLTAYSPAGCVDVTSQIVTVKEELIFYVPNAFTPDNDNYNEVFKPIFSSGFDPFNYNLLIFNRWGEVLFESNDTDFGWDGTYGGQIVQDGVYIWKIIVKRSGVDDREQYVGHVTLIR